MQWEMTFPKIFSLSSFLSLLLSLAGVIIFNYDHVKGSFNYSFIKVAYSCLLTFIFLSAVCFQTVSYFNASPDGSLMYGLLHLYPWISQTFMCILLVISCANTSRLFMNFMKNERNKSISQTMAQHLTSSKVFQHLLASSIILFMPHVVVLFFEKPLLTPINSEFTSHVFIIYNFIALNEFSLTLQMISSMYQDLNDRIKLLSTANDNPQHSAWFKTGTQFWKSRLICTAWTPMPTTNIPVLSSMSVDEDELKVYKLRHEHHRIYRLAREVNSFFSLSNLLLITHHGILGVIHSYWGLRQALAKNETNNWCELLFVFKSALFSFASIVWMFLPATKVVNEANRTAQLLKKKFVANGESSLRTEVHAFSLQLLLEDLSFSPFGFFRLDNELLLAMGGTVASYLVVLLQYQIMLDDQATSLTPA